MIEVFTSEGSYVCTAAEHTALTKGDLCPDCFVHGDEQYLQAITPCDVDGDQISEAISQCPWCGACYGA